jgi:uracil-DNA glycosylase
MSYIHESWKSVFEKHNINLDEIYDNINEIIYPPKDLVYKVFSMDVKDIKIVLLGQDCYHGESQAHGLSFSVPKDMKIPPSLKNIYKELKLEFPERNYVFPNGCLERWFNEEKIFLLNCSLTVEKGKAGSHMKKWMHMSNDVIKHISANNKDCVYLLLGNYAKSKAEFIDSTRVVSAPHPSPLARGFIGSNVFKDIENILGKEVNWNIYTHI